MNARTLTIQILAGVALLGIGVGIGVGIGQRERDREAEVPEVSGGMKPVLPGGASSVAEQTARGEIREFVPVRPFAKGKAEAWLLGLRGKGWPASMRALNTLDANAAKEVAAMIIAIRERLQEKDGDTVALWGSNVESSLLGSGLDVILSLLAEHEPESAVALANDLGEEGGSHALSVWEELARHVPGRLEALLATVVPVHLRKAVYGSVMGLLESDVEAGVALMKTYPGEEFESLRRDVINSLLKSDPRQAVALAATLAGAGQESWHLYRAIDEWFEKDEAAARQWIGEHDGPGRYHARARLLYHDAARDPAAAVAEFAALRQEGIPDEVLEGAVRGIAQQLGYADPQATRAWLDTLPAGSLRDSAARSLAKVWVEQDPGAASEWIATLPPGDQRDEGAFWLVDAIKKRDPAAALEWARNVSDEVGRREMIMQVLNEWRGQNPEAAEAAALGLPEEDRPSEIAEPVDF